MNEPVTNTPIRAYFTQIRCATRHRHSHPHICRQSFLSSNMCWVAGCRVCLHELKHILTEHPPPQLPPRPINKPADGVHSEIKGSWRLANENIVNMFNQSQSQTVWVIGGCQQSRVPTCLPQEILWRKSDHCWKESICFKMTNNYYSFQLCKLTCINVYQRH